MLTSIKRALKRRLAALVAEVVSDVVRRESSHQLFDISSERQRIALNNTARYVGRHMLHADVLQDRPHLLTFALERTTPHRQSAGNSFTDSTRRRRNPKLDGRIRLKNQGT